MNKHKVEDYFNFVFPGGESFFARRGRFTIIKGDPGAGKTTLSLEIARRISENKRIVFFISLEQQLKSLKLSMKRLPDTFGKYLESNRCIFYNEDTGWDNCNKIDVDLGVTIFFRPPVGFKSSKDLILWIQSKISEAKEKLGCSCGLVIIDNANVYVPKESKSIREPNGITDKTETKQLTLANPLNRESLQEIKYLAINQNASLILVVEQDRNHENLETDFYADAVIKLNKTDSEVANLIVVKSRHFPTSPGIHKVQFTTNSDFSICPSPESILVSSRLKRFNDNTPTHKKQFHVTHFPGWEKSFKNSSLLKYQDIILISGNRHSGKAIIRDQFVNSADNGAVLYWRRDAPYTFRPNEIKVDPSDITDPKTLLKLLDESDYIGSDFKILDSMLLISDYLEKQKNEKAKTLLAKIINSCIVNSKTFDKYINSEQFALDFSNYNDPLRDQYNPKQCMLLNRQIVEKLFHGQIKKLRQNFSLAPNPSWDSNRLFFEIYQAVTILFGYSFKDCVLGIDNLELMLDSFPKIKTDKQFLANLFALFRCLNLTVISTISPNNCSMGLEAENLADVVLKTNFLPTEGGSLEILEIHSKEKRGNAPEEKIGFDPIRGEVSSELLHTFKIAPNGKASRVNINIMMPYYSSSEIKHAHDVCEGISNFVGSEHVALTGITNNRICDGKSNSKFPFTVKDTDKVNTSALLSRLSAHPHDDLNILTIDDYLLFAESWQRQLDSFLEPLGSIKEWLELLGISNDEDFLLDFKTNSDGQVVAIPYMMDMGLWVTKEGKGECDLSKRTNEYANALSLENLTTLKEEIEKRYDTSNTKAPYISFSGLGFETLNCFFWEFLEAMKKNDSSLLRLDTIQPNQYFEKLKKLRELIIAENESPITDDVGVNLESVCWRSWYSRLSHFGKSYPDLLNSGYKIDLLPGRHIITSRYFVIPQRAACVKLGKKLIAEFASEVYARDRLTSLAGLSPYKKHYNEFSESPLVPIRVINRLENASKSDFSTSDYNEQPSFLSRNQLFKHYLKYNRDTGKLIKHALFANSDESMKKYIRQVFVLWNKKG